MDALVGWMCSQAFSRGSTAADLVHDLVFVINDFVVVGGIGVDCLGLKTQVFVFNPERWREDSEIKDWEYPRVRFPL